MYKYIFEQMNIEQGTDEQGSILSPFQYVSFLHLFLVPCSIFI